MEELFRLAISRMYVRGEYFVSRDGRRTYWLPSQLVEWVVSGVLRGIAKKNVGRCIVIELLV